MRSYIIFSLFIAAVCAASLGQKDDLNVSASSTTTTTESSVRPVEQQDELKETNSNVTVRIEEIKKTEESAESDKENKEKLPPGDNHVHTRQTTEYVRSGSQIIQNGGLFGINNGIGNGGTYRSERQFNTNGGLINNGGGVITDTIALNGGLLRPENIVYNQGISSSGGLINSGKLVSSGGLLSSGQVLNSGRIIETNGNKIYQSGGTIGSGPIGSGQVIETGQIIGTGIQGLNNGVLLKNNNYQNGNIGIGGGQIISNSGQSINRQIVIGGLDEQLNSVPQTVEYTKQFYNFEAPEEYQESGQITKQLSNVLKKNLQVVFINAPENTASTNAALQLAKQAIEQRTTIYLLTKETEAAQLVGQLEQIQENVQTKPEVRIIKYRTPEDLERAKLEIQSQYEATGGSTESFNGGVVPILNYASDARVFNKGIETLLGSGIVSSTTHLEDGHHGESSHVVSTVGSSPHQIVVGQNIASGKDVYLGSGNGQLNIIKNSNSGVVGSGPLNLVSNTGLSSGSLIKTNSVGTGSINSIGSGSLQGAIISPSSQFQSVTNSGSNKYFGTGGSLISPSNPQGSGSISTLNSGYTRELGSNSIVAPISKANGKSPSGNTLLIDSINVKKNDDFGSSSSEISESGLLKSTLIGLGSGVSNVIVSGPSKPIVIGSSIGSGSSTLGSGSNSFQSGSQTGSNVGTSKLVSGGSLNSGISSFQGSNQGSSTPLTSLGGSGSVVKQSNLSSGSGAGSSNVIGNVASSQNKATGSLSSFGTGSSNIVGSGSLQGTNTGNKPVITSFGTGSLSNNVGSGSLLGSGSGSDTVISNSGSQIVGSNSAFRPGSTNTFGSGSSLGSSPGSQSSFQAVSLKPVVASGGAGNYASQLTINSSKLSGDGSLSNKNTGSGSTFISDTGSNKTNDGVTDLSSTQIDHGSGSDGYVSGLGIGSSIGELVKKDNVHGSSSEKVLSSVDVTKPSVNRQYLPPIQKKKN